MTRPIVGLGGVLMLVGVGGCAGISADARIAESMDLVERQTGHRPDWSAPWDADPPTWDGNTVLDLDRAVALALANNRELRADLEMIGQANADLVQAGLLQNPSLNFMIMFPSGGGRTMLRSNALPMQPLQDLWLIPARKEVATRELQQAVLRVADRAVETAAAVKKLYVRLQYTRRAIDLITENTRVVDQSTRLIQARLSAGKASQTEVTLSQIRFLRLRSELLAMEAEHRAVQRQLLQAMGFAGATDAWTVAPMDEMSPAFDSLPEEDDLLALAAEHRLDLKAAEWTLAAAVRRIELMRREGWPEVALGFGFERMPAARSNNQQIAGKVGNAATENLISAAAGMPMGPPMVEPFMPKMREPKYTLGPMIEMELPIFDQNQAQVAKAVHEYRQRLAEYEGRAQEITRMVRETLVMWRQAHEQVVFYRDSMIPAVRRNLSLSQEFFVAGQEDLTIYLQTQEDLIMTRLRMLEFYRDYHVARAELERQVGGRLVPAGPSNLPNPPTPESRPATAPATTQPTASSEGSR